MVEIPVDPEDTASIHMIGNEILESMIVAVENVRDRLMRATSALERKDVPYAVIGGNAVAAWVSEIEPTAVRNTQDVDLLLNRQDLQAAEDALGQAGFVRRDSAGITMFLDGPGGRARDAIHVVFAGEKVRPEYEFAAPVVESVQRTTKHRVLALALLVQMKLTSFRNKDKVHLQDLASVGLIDRSWLAKLPRSLSERLQEILDNPDA
ncbi:MAG: hypothetical protein ACKO26_27355 [Planctomycetota bacterium]